MKITTKPEEIEVCDICHNGGYLQTCEVCEGRYCLSCDGGTMCGCVHSLDICRSCNRVPEVEAVAKQFAPKISRVLDKRSEALAGLRKIARKHVGHWAQRQQPAPSRPNSR